MIEKPLINEDARLLEEVREKKRLEEELIIAAQIQKRLLPQESPELANYGVLGFSDPCLKIGGDYYDFILKRTAFFTWALEWACFRKDNPQVGDGGFGGGGEVRFLSTRPSSELARNIIKDSHPSSN